jgi:pimeloyl-ACP methyl ester carboxylesterase
MSHFQSRAWVWLAAILSLMIGLPAASHAEERIGVLMLHGKNPGSAQDPYFGAIRPRLENEGMLTLMPDMPWSRSRYIDGNWDTAMAEIAQHVKTLRERGATRIVLMGHSLGVPAALSHAARNGDVQALVLLAPGHVPYGYYTHPSLKVVRDSIDEARAMVAAGKGDARERFSDINQGRPQVVVMTAADFLSYFDPQSDAEMSVTAPRVPPSTPAMVVIGSQDPLFSHTRALLFNRLPPNPDNLYLEISANHLTTPSVAIDAVVEWVKKVAAK